jgi:hypothetical protein
VLLAAVGRLDTWVFRVAIAIPVVCVAALITWHLLGSVLRLPRRRRRPVRLSPEPPDPFPRREKARPPRDDGPAHWEQVCARLEGELADAYLELAEQWCRAGRPLQATAIWRRVVQVCPDGPQARRARECLRGR